MSLRFRKSIRIAKGVRLNLSKGGVGLSIDGKGLRVGVGLRGVYTSPGIPGTGLYLLNNLGKKDGPYFWDGRYWRYKLGDLDLLRARSLRSRRGAADFPSPPAPRPSGEGIEG